MRIHLKCFSSLAASDNCDYQDTTPYDLANGDRVQDVFKLAGLDGRDVKIAFVNSRKVNFDHPLSDGDQVGLAPAVGGM